MAFQTGQKLLAVLLLATFATASPIGKTQEIEEENHNIPFTDIEKYLPGPISKLYKLLHEIDESLANDNFMSHDHLFQKAIGVLEDTRTATITFLKDFNHGDNDEFHLLDQVPCHYHYGSMKKEYQNASLSKFCSKSGKKEISLTIQSDVNCFLSSVYHMNSHLQKMLYHFGWSKMTLVEKLTQKLDTLADKFQKINDVVTAKIEFSCMNYTDTAENGIKPASNVVTVENGIEPESNETEVASVVTAENGTESASNETEAASVVTVENGIEPALNETEAASVVTAENGTESASNETEAASVVTVENGIESASNETEAASVVTVENGIESASNETEAANVVTAENGTESASNEIEAASVVTAENETESASVATNAVTAENETESKSKETGIVANSGNSSIEAKEKELLEKEKNKLEKISAQMLLMQNSFADLQMIEIEQEKLIEAPNGTESVVNSTDVISAPDNDDEDNVGMLEGLKNATAPLAITSILENGKETATNITEEVKQETEDKLIDVVATGTNITEEVKQEVEDKLNGQVATGTNITEEVKQEVEDKLTDQVATLQTPLAGNEVAAEDNAFEEFVKNIV